MPLGYHLTNYEHWSQEKAPRDHNQDQEQDQDQTLWAIETYFFPKFDDCIGDFGLYLASFCYMIEKRDLVFSYVMFMFLLTLKYNEPDKII